jgi:hypothetical protein
MVVEGMRDWTWGEGGGMKVGDAYFWGSGGSAGDEQEGGDGGWWVGDNCYYY